LKNTVKIRIKSSPGNRLRQGSFPVGVRWRSSFFSLQNETFKGRTTGLKSTDKGEEQFFLQDVELGLEYLREFPLIGAGIAVC